MVRAQARVMSFNCHFALGAKTDIALLHAKKIDYLPVRLPLEFGEFCDGKRSAEARAIRPLQWRKS